MSPKQKRELILTCYAGPDGRLGPKPGAYRLQFTFENDGSADRKRVKRLKEDIEMCVYAQGAEIHTSYSHGADVTFNTDPPPEDLCLLVAGQCQRVVERFVQEDGMTKVQWIGEWPIASENVLSRRS